MMKLLVAFVFVFLVIGTGINGLRIRKTDGEISEITGGFNVNEKAISVSGVSSGAAMATQLHVAHSASFLGCASIAGVPYYCAQSNITKAIHACMIGETEKPDMEAIYKQTESWTSQGLIDSVDYLKDSRVFVYHGKIDPTVNPESGELTVEFYMNYKANVAKEFSLEAGHGVPTESNGHPCNVTASPYINNCGYNTAYNLLNHIYKNLTKPTNEAELQGQLVEFDQSVFAGDSVGFDKWGFLYVPSDCAVSAESKQDCRLHMALHGCRQGRFFIGKTFVEETGYNEVADLNKIIIMYPQIINSTVNPYGCYDWFNYEAVASNTTSEPSKYATKEGIQVKALKAMIDGVTG